MTKITILKEVSLLFDSWNSRQIKYCHWKGTEHIGKGLMGGSDLDVFVDKKDQTQVEQTLKETGYVQFKTQWGYRSDDVYDWLGFDSCTGKLIHIHLHYRMISGHFGVYEYELPWGKSVLDDRIFDDNIGLYTINPELEILTLYARLCLEYPSKKFERKGNCYQLKKSTLNEIEFLNAKLSLEKLDYYTSVYLNISANHFIENLSMLINGGSQLPMLKKKLLKNVIVNGNAYCNIIKSFIYKTVRKTVFEFFCNKGICFDKKIPYCEKGLTIAFLGQDGAGKSTVTKKIVEWLSWKIDVNQFYLGSGDFFNPWEKQLQQKLSGKRNAVANTIRSIISIKLLSKLAKNVFRSIVKADSYSEKGGIAFYDRFPQNVVNGINDGPKIKSLILQRRVNGFVKFVLNIYAKKEEKYINKAVLHSPKIVFKLMLSPEESIKRKPFEDYDGIKKKHEIIKKLEFPKAEVYTIDATQDFEKELIEIKKIVWKAIQKL